MPKTKIVYAVDMLHYLPLFMAYERFLKKDFDIVLAPAPYGDNAAITRLMSTLKEDRDVHFCVCDPMMVRLSEEYSAETHDWPVAIAQLVQRVPFWAVNHQQESFNKEEGFFRFNQIFSYPPPNTGYVFGKFVHDQCSKARGANVALRSEKIIGADLDHYLTGDGAVVLEADILKIRKYIETTGNKVVFSFPNHNKFKNFCFTALLTQGKVLKSNDGKAEAHKLIGALHQAMYLIYHDEGIPLECAVRRFRNYDRGIIQAALNDLKRDKIFSKSLVISRYGWQKSIYIQRKVDKEFPYQSYHKFVNNSIAKHEYIHHLLSQVEGQPYIIIPRPGNIPVITPLIQFSVSCSLFLFPALFTGLPGLLKLIIGREQYSLFHLGITAFLLIIYFLRGRITSAFKLDPSAWLVTIFTLLVSYTAAEIGIIAEMLKYLTVNPLH